MTGSRLAGDEQAVDLALLTPIWTPTQFLVYHLLGSGDEWVAHIVHAEQTPFRDHWGPVTEVAKDGLVVVVAIDEQQV